MTTLRTILAVASIAGCGRRPEPSAERVPIRQDLPASAVRLDVPVSSAPTGLEYSRMHIAGTDVEAEVFVADLTRVRLSALDARVGEREGARVNVLRAEHDAWVVINGTFFDRAGGPMGLLRQGDVELSPLRKADWGVFETDTSGRARLVHTRDYVPEPDADFAVQCGPRIVIDGEVPSLKKQFAHRTALCVRGEREVVLLVTRGPVYADALGAWLAKDVACKDALLLDGGPSTQLAASFGDVAFDLHGGWGVPNGIAVLPRKGKDD